MENTPASEHVRRLLRSSEREDEEEVLNFAERLFELASEDDTARTVVDNVNDYIKGRGDKPQATEDTFRRYTEELHDRATEIGDDETPGVGLATTVLYRRATQEMNDRDVREALTQRLEQPTSLFQDVQQGLSEVEPDFAGQLIIQAGERRQDDRRFARKLAKSKREIAEQIPEYSRIANKFGRDNLDRSGRPGPDIIIPIPDPVSIVLIAVVVIIFVVVVAVGK